MSSEGAGTHDDDRVAGWSSGAAQQVDHIRPVPVLEIGGTHVAAALVDLAAGRVIPHAGSRRSLRGAAPARALLDQMVRCATDLPAPLGAAWGVAVPGPFDYENGVALFEGVGKFDVLDGVDLGKVLRQEVVPTPSIIRFVNDAIAFTVGEWTFGAGAGHDRVAGITLGTGVGSGFLAGGVPVDTGPDVPPGGEVHRLTINRRPLEDTISRRALLRAFARLAPEERGIDVRDIADQARAGNQIAHQVLRDAFTKLGTALAPWLARFHATALIVGGAMSRSWDLVFPPLLTGLRDGNRSLCDHLQVLPAQDLEHAALLGAAWHATHESGRTGLPAVLAPDIPPAAAATPPPGPVAKPHNHRSRHHPGR